MTDNANEAAKMKPRLAEVVGSGFRSRGLLGPLFFLDEAFAEDAGLG